MQTVFLVATIAGGIVLVLQFLAGTLGMLGETDLDHDHPDGGDRDHDHDHAGVSWFAGLITFRSITAGLTFFGLGGMTALYANADDLVATVSAFLSGLAALVLVAQIMKGLRRLRADGSAKIERSIGQEATVYLQIPANNAGPGKVTVVVQKRTMEYAAYTHGGQTLPTGSKVRIIAVRNPSTVEVEAV